MIVSGCISAFCAYSTYSFISAAYPVTAKVLKTDRADYLVLDTPSEFDIGKPYAGSLRKYSIYSSLISYQDPLTNVDKTTYLATSKEYKSQEELSVLVSKAGNAVLLNTFWGLWGSSFLYLGAAMLCGIFKECLEGIKKVEQHPRADR